MCQHMNKVRFYVNNRCISLSFVFNDSIDELVKYEMIHDNARVKQVKYIKGNSIFLDFLKEHIYMNRC